MTSEPFRPVLLNQADTERCWRHLINPLGFASASLWLLPIGDDGRPTGQVTEVTELPDPPEGIAERGFVELLRAFADEFGASRMAFLRSRPGAGGPDADDRRWAATLYSTAYAAGLECEVVHLATDHTILPLPLDELPAAG